MLVGLAGCATEETPPPPTAFNYNPTAAFFEQEQSTTAAGVATVTLATTPTPVTPTQTNTPQVESTDIVIATAPPITDTPTQTDTPTATHTLDVTLTPSPSITFTPTRTPTDTLTPAPTQREVSGLEQLAERARNATILPPDFTVGGTPVVPTAEPFVPGGTPSDLVNIYEFLDITPPSETGSGGASASTQAGFSSAANCAGTAPGGFAELELADLTVRGLLGCPVGSPPQAQTTTGAYQTFQSGFMLWLDSNDTIYVVGSDGTFTRYPDTWDAAADPESTGRTPPAANLTEPARGFGKVWRENPDVEELLGWAIGPEQGNQVTFTRYERGLLVYAPQRGDVLALADDGAWRGYAGSY